MDDKINSLLAEFLIKYDGSGLIKLPGDITEMLGKLKNKDLKISIKCKPDEKAFVLDLDQVLFSDICSVQGLPEEVVLDFLNSRGKLSKENG